MGSSDRRMRHKLGRKATILRVARDVFLAKGYTSTSMDQIAEEVGLSVGTLYLYFRNKPTLYMSILEVALQKQEKALRGALSSARNVAQRMLKLGDAYVDFFLREPEYFEALIFLQHGDLRIPESEELNQRLAERTRQILGILTGLIRAGMDSGEFRRVNATDTAMLFYGTWNGVIGLTLRKDPMRLERSRLKTLARFASKVLQDGLRAGTQSAQAWGTASAPAPRSRKPADSRAVDALRRTN